jgi:predicted ATPase
VVTLVGEAGVGKSRLLWELTRSPLAAGWHMLEAGGISYGRDIPYLPVVALLKSYFNVGDCDNEPTIVKKVGDRLEAFGEPLIAISWPILSLFGIGVEDPDWVEIDPLRRRDSIKMAVVRLLCRQSQDCPLILVVEDLHWIDNETQVLLGALVDAIKDARVLLLVNYRLGYHHRWSQQTSFTDLTIEPLSRTSAQQLAKTLLGDDPSVQELLAEVVERSEGNPFFLEESVNTLAEAKVLEGSRGAFRLTKGSTKLHVPASVRAVLGSRIDRLLSADKRLLQAASAIGSKFPFALLMELMGNQRQEPLHGQLVRLKEAGLIYESNLYPQLEYSFTHTLTQEVA